MTNSKSSFIETIGPWDRFSHRTQVKLRSGHRYDVSLSEAEHNEFVAAESHGEHFNKLKADGKVIRKVGE